jgi:hypothetical protein
MPLRTRALRVLTGGLSMVTTEDVFDAFQSYRVICHSNPPSESAFLRYVNYQNLSWFQSAIQDLTNATGPASLSRAPDAGRKPIRLPHDRSGQPSWPITRQRDLNTWID